MAYLEFNTPKGTRRVALSEAGQLTIGRLADNTIALPNDNLVSRKHCAIAYGLEGYVLNDLGSRNGTVVENEEVRQYRLRDGVRFFVGDTQFRFRDAELPTASPGQSAAEKQAAVAGGARDQARAQQVRSKQARPPQATMAAKPAASVATGDAMSEEDFAAALQSGLTVAGGDGDAQGQAGEEYLRSVLSPNIGGGGIEGLASIGEDIPFDADDLTLYNTRGQAVHAATPKKGKPDKAQGTADAIHLLRLVLVGCVRSKASDIHVEPKMRHGIIRLRVDGTMVEVCNLEPDEVKRLNALVKVLCEIDPTQKSIVQDGHFSVDAPGRRIDYRVSFTPAMHGQKLVIRVLDPLNAPRRLKQMGMPGWMLDTITRTMGRNQGMLLSCGPTGSGKTTTLYAALREVDARVRNVITIEDPVEYEIDGVTQMPVDAEQGQTFAALLRSVLRQDPDVIFLGEVRDGETAEAAMQASNTGHLVLTTVHANDSIGAIFRLMDLGVEPYLVANSLNIVLAQRLVRTLCPHCKRPVKATAEQLMKLKRQHEGIETLYKETGCEQCFGTGNMGRAGLFELLQCTDAIRDVILNQPTISKIKKALSGELFQTLEEVGHNLVLKGECSYDEVDRVVGTG